MIIKKQKKKELTENDIKNIIISAMNNDNSLNWLKTNVDNILTNLLIYNKNFNYAQNAIKRNAENNSSNPTYKIVKDHITFETDVEHYTVDDFNNYSFIDSLLAELFNKYAQDGYDIQTYHITDVAYYTKNDLIAFPSTTRGHSKPYYLIDVKIVLKKYN